MIKKLLFSFVLGALVLGIVDYSQLSFADLSFSDGFGSKGNDNDEFDNPTDLAISEDGKKLYVVDSENDRIKMYDLTGGSNCPSGTDEIIEDEVCFDDTFGSSGSSDGRFDIPTDLAIDKDNGDIYVVDSDNNRVQKFDDGGDYELEFGSSDSGDDEYLGTPSAIAVHKKSDYVYVADSSLDSISVFDDKGNFKFSFDDDGSNDEFRNPSGMVIDDANEILYVADTDNDRIRIYELTDGDNCPSGTDEVVNNEVCFVDDFGSLGSSDGKFNSPIGLAFDEDDDILYVADSENDRIQVFEIVSGNTCPSDTERIIDGVCFVEEFGSSGNDDGEFSSPSGLALDKDNGILYVADTSNHKIQLLSLTGGSSDSLSFSNEFGERGTSDSRFDKPTDLAINSNDILYVVDTENNRIKMYDLTGGSSCPSGTDEIIEDEVCFDDTFGSSGSSDGKFNSPTKIAIDKDNRDIYVVDSDNNRVQKFQEDGDFDNLEFGSSDSGDDEYLGSPSAIEVHKESDYIYVADSSTDSISIFDDDGDFRFNFGDTGSSDDEFRDPSGMVIDQRNDILYVADTDNNRIKIYELTDGDSCPSGTDDIIDDEVCFVDDFGSSVTGEGRFDEPSGLAYDEDNDILYVADTGNHRIQVFEIVSGNTCPSDTERIIDGVCFVEEFGSSGNDDGEFSSPSGLALDDDNRFLYVADTNNHRIQMLALPNGDGSGSGSGSSSSSKDAPDPPENIEAFPVSPTSIVVTWDAPTLDDDISEITGYKIDFKLGSENYQTAIANTASTSTLFIHKGLDDDERYSYRVYAINKDGTSSSSSIASAQPEPTTTPVALSATAISKSQIKLSWLAPSETFGQSISGYEVKRVITPGVYDVIGNTNSKTTSFLVSNLQTDKTYTYAVSANIGFGSTGVSNTASATPTEDSVDTTDDGPVTSTSVDTAVPSPPIKLTATAVGSTQINLSWNAPSEDGNSPITGYKIQVKRDNGQYTTLVTDTKTTVRTYSHTNLITDSKYTYKVSAINAKGTSDASNEVSATTQFTGLQISPIGNLSIDEGKLLSFTVRLTDSSLQNVVFSLEKNPPSGAKIVPNTGQFSWTPSSSDGGKSYTFDIVAKKDSSSDRKTITINVKDTKTTTAPTPPEPLQIPAPFVDQTKDPQSYVDRYQNEDNYKEWFDDNFPEYDSIYQAVGLEEPLQIPAPFVDQTKDPQSYVDRYQNEDNYKEWFDDNFPEYDSIYQAVGLEDPSSSVDDDDKPADDTKKEKKYGICGPGTKLIDGVCTIVEKPKVKPWWQFW